MYGIFIDALRFAADKHVLQRRKGCDSVPYINHPIKVVQVLYHTGSENDPELLAAAVLHDVIEDTDATEKDLRAAFGNRVTDLVLEVSDDMSLNYEDRKRYQIKSAASLSDDAKKIKIADKISNIYDILHLPLTWSHRRKQQYIEWADKVVQSCRGVNPKLDEAFDNIMQKAVDILKIPS
jgi:GTP diphosphokinase / guanosine-3',5'-bis(diphosphate) 3'-diphosphatase